MPASSLSVTDVVLLRRRCRSCPVKPRELNNALMVPVRPSTHSPATRPRPAARAAKGSAPLYAPPSIPDERACRLLEAASTGSQQRTTELLAAGVPASCADLNGLTPLHRAAANQFDAIAALLIDFEPQCVHARDMIGNAPLHAAAFSGSRLVCARLLAARAEVEVADRLGNTPLHRAALEGNVEVAELLLASGADANARGDPK